MAKVEDLKLHGPFDQEEFLEFIREIFAKEDQDECACPDCCDYRDEDIDVFSLADGLIRSLLGAESVDESTPEHKRRIVVRRATDKSKKKPGPRKDIPSNDEDTDSPAEFKERQMIHHLRFLEELHEVIGIRIEYLVRTYESTVAQLGSGSQIYADDLKKMMLAKVQNVLSGYYFTAHMDYLAPAFAQFSWKDRPPAIYFLEPHLSDKEISELVEKAKS